MISQLKRLIEIMCGVRVYRRGKQGLNVFDDIRMLLPETEVKVVFDVGANVGQSTLGYLAEFHHADIYSFEPLPSTFEILQRVARTGRKNRRRVQCFQLALGATVGQGLMEIGASSRMARLASGKEERKCFPMVPGPTQITTLDAFSAEHGVSEIDYLKIDTEGNDLEVLKGGENLLWAQRVGVLEVEVGTHRSNERHVPFQVMHGHLENRGYRLLGIYDQTHEWIMGQPHLRRVNCVYIAERLARPSSALVRTA